MMINLPIDIPMNDKAFDPPVESKRLRCAACAVALQACPDSLFQFVEADRRRDGHGRVVGVGSPGHGIGDAVLDRQGDFVEGGRGRVLVCKGSVYVSDGRRVVQTRVYDQWALRHRCGTHDRDRRSTSWPSGGGGWQHVGWRLRGHFDRAPVDVRRFFRGVGRCSGRSRPSSLSHASRAIPFPLRLPERTFNRERGTVFLGQ